MDQSRWPPELVAAVSRLTATERACLERVSAGKKSKEIARDIGITPHTVDSSLRDACAKLGVKSRFVAANLLKSAVSPQPHVTATSPDPNFGSQISALSTPSKIADMAPSPGNGHGSSDPNKIDPAKPESGDFSTGKSWLREPHLVTTFFDSENRLSKKQRLIWIVATGLILVLLYGGIVDGLVAISKLVSSP